MADAVKAAHLDPADEQEMLDYFADAATHLVNRP
jgi:truncated hemoglobin YjbI